MNKESNIVKEACFRILEMTETTKNRGIRRIFPALGQYFIFPYIESVSKFI